MTEPATSLLASKPLLASLPELLLLADTVAPETGGLAASWHVMQSGVAFAAQVKFKDVTGKVVAKRTFNGDWEAGGQVVWRMGGGK
jgi:hypothetical protein